MIHSPDVAKKYAPDAVIGTLGDGGEDDDDEEDDSSEGSYTMEEVAKDNKKGDAWVVFEWSCLQRFKFLVSASWRRVGHIDFCREGCHHRVRHDPPA